MAIDEQKLNAFMERFMHDIGAAVVTPRDGERGDVQSPPISDLTTSSVFGSYLTSAFLPSFVVPSIL